MKKLVLLLILLVWIINLTAQEYNVNHGLTSIDKIYAPVVVGKPPANAASGLVKLNDGEIRNYPFGSDPDGMNMYTYSLDSGLTWKVKHTHEGHIGADYKSPVSGEYIRIFSERENGIFCARTEGGIDGKYCISKIFPFPLQALRNPIYLSEYSRILIGGSWGTRNPDYRGSMILYSDDDGKSWNHSSWVSTPDFPVQGDHKSTRWHQNGLEPTIVKLNDGRIWMILRTSHDNFFESFSNDGGETWTEPVPSCFFGTNTMPTLKKLEDGRLLFLWCNSTPLPEFIKSFEMKHFFNYKEIVGIREDVFTNRDVIHVAISEDDGKTWQGFRELYLNERRNDSNYGLTGGIDRSVHQTQAIEVVPNKILLSCGQHPLHRVILAFDVNWIYEKEREENFSEGANNLCVFQYMSGKVGHCALNREVGAMIIDDPENKKNKVLKICNPMNHNLVIENQGATWNFPGGVKGAVSMDIFLTDEFKGGQISLIDRWFNPVDTTAYKHAMFSLEITPDAKINGKILLQRNKWHQLRFEWDGVTQEGKQICQFKLNEKKQTIGLPLITPSVNGISYLHFQSRANEKDTGGFYVDNLKAIVN